MINVLMVDDHAIVRQGVCLMLEQTDNIRVGGEAANASEAMKKIAAQHFDVVVLDISLPDISGLEVLKRIKNEHPSVRVLMLSTYAEKQYAVRSLKGGAFGYLTKESVAEELIEAIQRIAGGRKYISLLLAEKIANNYDDAMKAPHELLSDREFQIFILLGKGETVSIIAARMSLSIPTINTYRLRVLKKLGISSNVDIIRYVIENKLA